MGVDVVDQSAERWERFGDVGVVAQECKLEWICCLGSHSSGRKKDGQDDQSERATMGHGEPLKSIGLSMVDSGTAW